MWKQQKQASTYLITKVTGTSTERFLNMCRHKNIVFWEIKLDEDGFTGKITRNDFLKLKDVCHKTKMRVRIKKKKGIRFLLFKYRKHYSFLVGILISCTLLYICSIYIWDVSFTGNSEYTNNMLLKYLTTLNVRPGVMISDIDCDKIESSIRNEYDNITWVSAEIRGTRLIVHIKENDGARQISNEIESERDIVATESGTVSSIITRSGTPKVKPGDNVEKGQILVSGVVNVHNDAAEIIGKRYTAADADILINTTLNYTDTLNIAYDYKAYTGKNYTVYIAGVFQNIIEAGIHIGKLKDCDVVTNVNTWKLTDSFYLPIRTGTRKYLEYEIKTAEYTDEEAKDVMNQKLKAYIDDLLENNVQIIENSVKIEKKNLYYCMEGSIRVKMPAYQYASITDTEPITDITEKNEEENINERN